MVGLVSKLQQSQANLKFIVGTAPKCLNAVTLIRMNLAVAKRSGVTGSPRFQGNWDLKNIGTVEALYHRVVEELNGETAFALYNSYSLIFGEEVAQRVARYRQFAAPPM